MAEILAVATHEFAQKGLAGARIDEIAERTRTNKRMIYYYFQSKEALYVAVLEEAYRRIRDVEGQHHLDGLPPQACGGDGFAFCSEISDRVLVITCFLCAATD